MAAWLPWAAWGLAQLPNLNGRMPVAPVSCQQSAARYEVSVQQMVCGPGGHTIGELEEALEERWAFRFRVSKVWRASDAISESGVYRLLEHHWLIFQLDPVSEGSPQPAEAAPGGEDEPGASAAAERPGKRPAPAPGGGGRSKARRGEAGLADAAAAVAEGQAAGDGCPPAGQDDQQTAPEAAAPGQEAAEPGIEEGAGLALADAGGTWFLRVDRFDTADKWFACGSLAEALQTRQARERHHRPDSRLVMQAAPGGRPLFLDCLLPLLARLAAVDYSVFARGTHCQWHARTLACLAASAAHLLDPASLAPAPAPQVSALLTDGREQQRYAELAGRLGGRPDGEAAAFARRHPEAPFLRACLADLQRLAQRHPGRLPAALAAARFPDLHFCYTALRAADGG